MLTSVLHSQSAEVRFPLYRESWHGLFGSSLLHGEQGLLILVTPRARILNRAEELL